MGRGETSFYIANLSLAFARLGYRSGILDADIFGPSIPTLFDLTGEPRLSSSKSGVGVTVLHHLTPHTSPPIQTP